MVASCYRRMGNEQKAIELYERIHEDHPDNIDCLQYLVSLLKGTGQNYEHYSTLLKKLLREKEMNDSVPKQNEEVYSPPPMPQQPVYEEQPQVPQQPVQIQQRPGTSRKGRAAMSTKQDEDEWANQELNLP
mmetsp:Transcript_8312/g.8198  ORF Transcript_8312/g.8198 Transcript_8312/m.8198 type:complete len:131 (-) Transcript_8312:17-409(-)